MELKGSKTEKNLEAAFAGESMARNKYTFYGAKAREDGYVQIAELFEETANNERAHAELWYKLLKSGIGAKIMNGATCIPLLRKKQEKRALILLQSYLTR